MVADLPPNWTILVGFVVSPLLTVGLPLFLGQRRRAKEAEKRTKELAEQIGRQVLAVHSTVNAKTDAIEEKLDTGNGASVGRTAELLTQAVARLSGEFAEHLIHSERAREEFRNDLRTHLESVGHPEALELLMRLVEQFRGPDGAQEARIIQGEVREDFAKRKQQPRPKVTPGGGSP